MKMIHNVNIIVELQDRELTPNYFQLVLLLQSGLFEVEPVDGDPMTIIITQTRKPE